MISFIIPFYNEEENIEKLLEELTHQMHHSGQSYEIVLVDDGSTDHSKSKVEHSRLKSEHVKMLHHRKRMGKGAALNTGIKHSTGDIVFFMDGDLQNDPKDIPKFLEKIHQGYEFVNGIRNKRDDNALIQLYSRFANSFVQTFVNSPFTDVNCGFKAMKREVLSEFAMYGNNFRFLPLAAYYKGFKVSEVEINNRPRIHGQSKFGTMKVFVGLLDTLTAYFLYRFSERPLIFFGTIGGLFFGIGFVIALYLTIERLFYNVLLYQRPLLQLAALLIIVGIQIIMTGFIGELVVYLDKKSSSRHPER